MASQPPPPYGIIAEQLKKGLVVPFLGAGVNFGTRPPNAPCWGPACRFLPKGDELSLFLAEQAEFPADERRRTDLAKISSYYVDAGGRASLKQRLHDIFDRDCQPCIIHSCLAEVARSTPLLIVTTNYDDLTESAFANLRHDRVIHLHLADQPDRAEAVLWWPHEPDRPDAREPTAVHPRELARLINLTKTTVIYKMHGTVDRRSKWDSYVITEDDYVDFLSRMARDTAVPPPFITHFRDRHFLFLGYGLQDWNFRVVEK